MLSIYLLNYILTEQHNNWMILLLNDTIIIDIQLNLFWMTYYKASLWWSIIIIKYHYKWVHCDVKNSFKIFSVKFSSENMKNKFHLDFVILYGTTSWYNIVYNIQ